MRRVFALAATLLAAITLSACHQHTEIVVVHGIALHHGTVVLSADGQPDAHIGADGSLRIGGRDVAVDAASRALLHHYYLEVAALTSQARAMRKAGTAFAGHTLGAVARNLLAGTPDRIGTGVNAQAQKLQAGAARICADVVQLGRTQDALATRLPAFHPYGTLVGHAERCNASTARKAPAAPPPPTVPPAPANPASRG